ncbi:MAG: hypothetical protein JSW25_07815 [Thermoplasmata archaeon]|nr:MAG: hypothetical protein JSW25_07815 [Thermoplasmata archaeon]
MAATVNVREKNGTGETPTNKDGGTVRFKNADNATVDLNNPLIVPTSNREYSYEKWLRFYIGATGPSSQITNLEFYMDGSKGWQAGVKLWADGTETTYSTPGVPTETNDPPQVPVNGTPASASDAFGYTSGTPLSLGSGPYSSTSADMGNYLILVMEVETGSTPELLTAEQATFEYDEI